MKTYIMLINGSVVAPQLTHEFVEVNDESAMVRVERMSQNIHSGSYWRYDLFEKDPSRHVASYESKINVVVRKIG